MNRKPELLALVVCERILEDQYSRMTSLINIINKIEGTPTARPLVSIRLDCLATLADGEEGSYQCQWRKVFLNPYPPEPNLTIVEEDFELKWLANEKTRGASGERYGNSVYSGSMKFSW
jgi:hypothetical protein